MPGQSYVLGIVVYQSDGSSVLSNALVTIRNENTSETQTGITNSSGQIVFNLANFTSGWTIGDIISYFVLYQSYEAYGSFTTANEGGAQKTLTLISVASTPSLRYFTVQEFLDTYGLPSYDDDPENGIKTQVIVKIGESIESHIDQICNQKFDSNNSSYYTITQEYHNTEGYASTWPNDRPNTSSQNIYFLKRTPVVSLTTFQVNRNGPNQSSDWVTLTEANNEISLKENIGRIEITDMSDYPAAGKDQVRVTYTYGYSSVPPDVKRLAILMSGKSLASQMLQKLNLTTSEANGLSSSLQNLLNPDNEINSILDNRMMREIRSV